MEEANASLRGDSDWKLGEVVDEWLTDNGY